MSVPSELSCHPGCARGAVRSIRVTARRRDDGALALRYALAADMSRIVVPPAGDGARADGLWRHTCFECFVRGEGAAYLEFNFSPSRAWAAYAFSAYREPAPAPSQFDPRIGVEHAADALELDALVPADRLPRAGVPLRIGLSAVIEAAGGALSYWALRHAPGKPDFHHPDVFALTV